MCIGLVLVGVVACVSMAVAVWSVAKLHNTSNSYEAWKEAIDSEIIGEVHSETIDYFIIALLLSIIILQFLATAFSIIWALTSYSRTVPSVLACVT